MDKLLEIVFVVVLIYFWNRFVPKIVVKFSVNFQKKYNTNNLHRQPIKYLIENEERIIKAFQAFYWIGAVVIIIGILLV